MQLTTRGRYGVMAMVELAARGTAQPSVPVGLAEIAASQQLSVCYLEQIFGALRRSGLVVSARGPGGGYRLARPADRTTLAEILEAVGEDMRVTRCDGVTPGCLSGADGTPVPCRTHDLWEALGRHLRSFLSQVTLADVLAGDLREFQRPRRVAEAAV
jgi:Rrf2 family iron-sulfur cluster assembly transcriptional regulator